MREGDVENADETQLVIDMNNKKMLGFLGEDKIKYSDVVSGGDRITMLVRISGGQGSMVQNPFLVFQNRNRNYPRRGVEDYIPGVS